MAADPDIGAVLSELVETSAGHEIYLRRPEHFGLGVHEPASFEQVNLLGIVIVFLSLAHLLEVDSQCGYTPTRGIDTGCLQPPRRRLRLELDACASSAERALVQGETAAGSSDAARSRNMALYLWGFECICASSGDREGAGAGGDGHRVHR